MKKVIFAVLALIFAIALVTGGYFLITSLSLHKYSVDEGVPCPYSWRELRSGAYQLEIDTTAYPDHSWSVECYPKNVIAAAETDSDAGTAVFSILPLNMGQAYVNVYCDQTSPLTVRIFEIGLQINVSEDLEITVENTEHTIYDGVTSMDTGGEYPIQWWANPNGVVNLLISEESNSNWVAEEYPSDSMDVTGPFYRDGSCGFAIQGKVAGTFPLVISDGVSKALRLELNVTEDLTASIISCKLESYTPDRSEKHATLENTVGGSVVLPPQAMIMKYSILTTSGYVDFMLNDQEWRWHISPSATAEELLGDIVTYASEKKTTTLNDVMLTAYRFSDGVAVSWSCESRAMVLYGQRETTLADALNTAGRILEANHG